MTGSALKSPLVETFDVDVVRCDFPILTEQINGRTLIYLDNAATTQKPAAVIAALASYYRHTNANVHRGVHTLSGRATDAYEGARERVRAFINANSTNEVVFTRGTTEAINLVAHSLSALLLEPGDEILIGESEHHSNIVPWQIAAHVHDAKLIVAPIDLAGDLVLDEYKKRLGERTRIVALGHVSNALGTINPVAEMTRLAHEVGATVLIDGAQALAHTFVDVQAIGCDFYAFSGHKVYGPTGIGALYGRAELLDRMPPYQSGGDMIAQVSFEKTEYNEIPYKFEAGTPNIAGAIGLGAALDYLNGIDFSGALKHEDEVFDYATERATQIAGLDIVGTAQRKTAVLSFVVDGVHPHDLGMLLDTQGIAIRTGHHCAMPVMQHFGISGTSRASFALYNSREEVDLFFEHLQKALDMLR